MVMLISIFIFADFHPKKRVYLFSCILSHFRLKNLYLCVCMHAYKFE